MRGCVTRAATCLVLALLSWGGVTAAASAHTVSDLQHVFAQNKLVVALVDSDYPPLFSTSEKGHLEGLNISLVQDMARELGVQVEFVRKTHAFEEVIDIVSRGEADIGLATSITLSRAQKVLFIKPYMTLKMALLLNRLKLIEQGLSTGLKTLAELRHTTQPIGVLEGSAYADYARKHFPQAISDIRVVPQ